MGKKPAAAIVGLIWAGMALVGCQNCKNCRNRSGPSPAPVPVNGAPLARQDSSPVPSVLTPNATAGGAARPETAKAIDAPGTRGFGTEPTAIGKPVSTGSAPAPAMQQSLSPTTDVRPPAPPGQGSDYRSGESVITKSAPADGGSRLPPRPVSQVNSGVPANPTEALPAIVTRSPSPSPLSTNAPPPPPLSTGTPPPPPVPMGTPSPIPSLPPVPGAVNSLPPIDSNPK